MWPESKNSISSMGFPLTNSLANILTGDTPRDRETPARGYCDKDSAANLLGKSPSIKNENSSKDMALVAMAAYSKALQHAMASKEDASHKILIQNQATSHVDANLQEEKPVGGFYTWSRSIVDGLNQSFQTFWRSRLNRCIFFTGLFGAMYLYRDLRDRRYRRKLVNAQLLLTQRRPLFKMGRAFRSLFATDPGCVEAEVLLREEMQKRSQSFSNSFTRFL